MQSSLAVFAIVALLQPAGKLAQASPDAGNVSRDTKKSEKKAARGSSSWTGCVDEQDGVYVLTDDQTLRTIAVLEAQSFPREGFAKHVGHKVTVRGSVASSGDRTVIKVREIRQVSEICAPPNGN